MNIALIGYGKMGKAIEEAAIQKGHHIVLKISSQNTELLTAAYLHAADVAIEFTEAQTASTNLKACFDAGIPVICGTTGWLNHFAEIENYCIEKKGTFLYASNFSIGVNIFFELNNHLAQLMAGRNEYDVMIEETHHTQKKDAPSGTAISLAEQILHHSVFKTKWINTFSDKKEDLQVISKRVDPAAGTHKIKYFSAIDDIEIIHTAHNRQGFAEGAVLAAAFICGKKGIYSMRQVLGF